MKALLTSLLFFLVLSVHAAEPTAKQASQTEPPMSGEVVVYKTVDGRDLRLFMIKPDDWKAEDRRPAIVFFHGGGWKGGSPKQFEEQSKHFAKEGIVCLNVEYRLAKQTPPDVCIADAKSAMRYVRSHAAEFGVDPTRIAASGGSAGGHLAAATALLNDFNDSDDDKNVSARPDALVLFNPVIDNSADGYGNHRLGENWRDYSPAHHVTRDAPPTILFVGSKDKHISVAAVERFRDEMQQMGVRCEAKIYEGQPHGFFNYRRRNKKYYHETLRDADVFLSSLGWIAPAGEAK